jgi:MFS family permease
MCLPQPVTDDVRAPKDTGPTSAGPGRLGPPYWRLWTSAGLSGLADGIFRVSLPLVAIGLTRSPTLIAGMTVALTLPWLLFALPAGALVDRFDRRLGMVAANAVRAALLAVLVVTALLDVDSIWVLYAVAFCAGAAETVYDTSSQSILPQLVERAQLPRANGHLYAAQLGGSEFVGPPLAGILVGVGAAVAFGTPLLLWLAATGMLLLVRGAFRTSGSEERTTLRSEIAEGLRFLWRHRVLRTFTLMVGVFNFSSNAAGAILVLYAVGPLSPMKLSEQGFGVLLATVALGSMIGSFLAQRVERALGRARSIAIAFAAGAGFVGVPALTANPYIIGIAFLIGGAGVMISNIVMVSLRQAITPDRVLGRLSSSHRLVAYGTQPLGAVLGGALAQVVGLRAVFAVTGLLALSVVLGVFLVTDSVMDAAERQAA